MSPITSWDGAAAVFTFGPDSPGIWLFLAITLIVMTSVVARMIAHENHTFRKLDPDLVEGGAMKGVNL